MLIQLSNLFRYSYANEKGDLYKDPFGNVYKDVYGQLSLVKKTRSRNSWKSCDIDVDSYNCTMVAPTKEKVTESLASKSFIVSFLS